MKRKGQKQAGRVNINMKPIETYFKVGKLNFEDQTEATHSAVMINGIKDYLLKSKVPETLPETGPDDKTGPDKRPRTQGD